LIEFQAIDLPNCEIYGYITKTVLSGSVGGKVTKDATLCYLNFRPIDLPKGIKNLFEEMYRLYNPAGTI